MRIAAAVAVVFILSALWGCGGDGGTAALTNPSGRVIAGTGPVTDVADARQRVLSQYLGLSAATRAVPGQPRVGALSDPFTDVCEIPGGALPAGTRVRGGGPGSSATVLAEPFYVYWVDPEPALLLGHPCFVLYVKASDGTLVEQPALLHPYVNDLLPLYGLEAQAAQRIYEHPAAGPAREILHHSTDTPAPTRQVSDASLSGVAIGAGDSHGANGAFVDQARDVYEHINGDADDFVSRTVRPPADDVTPADLARLLGDASAGQGDGDKCFVMLFGHATPEGIRLGRTEYTWRQLCEILDQNVAAGHLNLIVNGCYAGSFVPILNEWDDRSSKAVRFVGTTDASHVTVDQFALELIIEQIKAGVDAIREETGGLTLDELEDVMAGLFITALDVERKGDEIFDAEEERARAANDQARLDQLREMRERVAANPKGDVTAHGFPRTAPVPFR